MWSRVVFNILWAQVIALLLRRVKVAKTNRGQRINALNRDSKADFVRGGVRCEAPNLM